MAKKNRKNQTPVVLEHMDIHDSEALADQLNPTEADDRTVAEELADMRAELEALPADATEVELGPTAKDAAIQAAEIAAQDELLGTIEVPAVTETTRAKGNRKFTVGSAVDGTIFALVPGNEPKARPNTLAGALYDELKVNGPGTVSELVDRLNRDGVYERVALKSATLRPYSSVAYWLKTWRKEGHCAVVIPGAEVEAPATTEAPTVEQVA